MKTRYVIAFLFAILVSMVGCDKDFEEINIDPLAPTSLDASYLLADVQDMAESQHHYEACIVQQLNLIITGQEDAGAHNIEKADIVPGRWNSCYGNLKTLTDILVNLKNDALRTNLYNMARIMTVWNYMILVDTYGDVPYTEAIKGYYTGNFYPKYDNQEDIYADLAKELEEATDALDNSKDVVTNDMYYQGNIAKWKKLGNSLLLRLGMRYSKSDAAEAQRLVGIATSSSRGGVMETNADNVIIPYNATQTNATSGFMNSSVRQNWHIGRPLVNWMQANNDPRIQYIMCRYDDPNSTTGGTKDNTPANQLGAPFGYDPATIANDPLYPGIISSSIWDYSFPDRQTIGKRDAICNFFTAAQTQLLMAEARQRGWITGGSAKAYYDNAITQHMTMKDFYRTTRNADSPITQAQIDAYLVEPNIAYNSSDLATALNQINSQYWMACFLNNFHEGWCNFRRSGYPALSPINYPGEDPAVTAAGGFIHRMTYPDSESNYNTANCEAASARIGGDNLGTRIFWDTP